MPFEPVHTVWDYYDGPRVGLADFEGKPHYYYCEWAADAGGYADTYRLSPVDADTLQLAQEQWQLWRDWEAAFHAGKVTQESHPGHGGTNERYDQLEEMLQERLASCRALPSPYRGTFRPAAESSELPKGVTRDLEVEWHRA